jgi:CheY-like chemotaxis protein
MGGVSRQRHRTAYPLLHRSEVQSQSGEIAQGLPGTAELSQPYFQDIPKLVISSSVLEEDLARSLLLGATAYFIKPNRHHDLVELVRQWKKLTCKALSALESLYSPKRELLDLLALAIGVQRASRMRSLEYRGDYLPSKIEKDQQRKKAANPPRRIASH